MMKFTRTPSGLTNRWQFHKKPTVWVEGPTDINFYKPILDRVCCRFQSYDGYENSKPLIKDLVDNNHPYLVILDGDYRILKQSPVPHKSVITLPRYSCENFLWEPSVVNEVCCVYAECQKDMIFGRMEKARKMIKKELLKLITLDVAARELTSAPAVLPRDINSILKNNASIDEVNQYMVNAIIMRVTDKIEKRTLKEAKVSVSKFIQNHCITHLIRGHTLFSLLRRIVTNAIRREIKIGRDMSNEDLMELLSDAIWKHCKSPEHKRLKHSFRKKLREVAKRFDEHKKNPYTSL